MSQVTDYIIDNASGASVRSDLNLVFDAIKTLNSGGSNPANTEAFMPFVDTGDGNKLKIRNSSNNDFTTIGPVDTPNLGLLATTGGTMTGALQLPVGSATAPSINFGQTNTGIFRGSSHRVSFTSAGTQVFYVDSTGININSSKEVRWKDSNNTQYIGFKAPSNITSNFTLTLPDAGGSSGQALITNGSGTLSFGAPTVGAANLTGNTLASGVTASSLTSVGTLSSLAVSGTCTAGTFSGSGASLTNIPAGQLTGTVADARISSLTSSKLTGALPALDGSALTNLNVATPLSKVASVIQSGDFTLPTGQNTFVIAGDGTMTRTVTAQSNDTYVWVQYDLKFETTSNTQNSNNRVIYKVSLYKNGVFNQDIVSEQSIATTAVVQEKEDFKFIPTSFSANDSIEVRVLHRSYSTGSSRRGVFKSGSYLNVFCVDVN